MAKCKIILVKEIRKFYDNNGNIYTIMKKRNNNVYLTITNKLVFNKTIATGKSEILELFKFLYKTTQFLDNPILEKEIYLY